MSLVVASKNSGKRLEKSEIQVGLKKRVYLCTYLLV